MITPKDNLLEDITKCLTDPLFDIIKNFSLQKSKDFYSKWNEARENGCYSNNPAAKKEMEEFLYKNLEELSQISEQAKQFYHNINNMPYCKNVRYEVGYDKIVIHWKRLKTFDEWLHDGLRDALVRAIDCPEDGARMILERELGRGIYTNTAIHMFAEGKIDKETLKRLGTYERYMRIDDRDMEEDITQVRKALEDMDECNTIKEIENMLKRKDVTVLKLKK